MCPLQKGKNVCVLPCNYSKSLQQSRLNFGVMIEFEQASAQAIVFSILSLGSISCFMN